MTEVLKKQCSKSKKCHNQVNGGFIPVTEICIAHAHPPSEPTLLLLKPLLPSHSLSQHISVSQAKVDKVQVNSRGDGTTFAVCLDQDEKKFIQRVTRCRTESSLTLISLENICKH